MYDCKIAMTMLNNGLTETLCNVIHRLCLSPDFSSNHQTHDTGDINMAEGVSKPLDDVKHLFCCISRVAIRYGLGV
jgi:hypothetical protein